MTIEEILTTIKRKRKQMGLTLEQVAEMAGMRRQVYERIESGKSSPNMTSIEAICKALDLRITVDEIKQ